MTDLLSVLAKSALPINDEEWGSARQIRAQNLFFDYVKDRLTKERFERLEEFCLKATVEEMVQEALKAINEEKP